MVTLSSFTLGLTLTNVRTFITMIFDIFVMWFILFYALKIVRTNQRTIQIFKGIILVIVIDALAKVLGLKTLEFLADIFINYGFLAIIIIFQPEIRSLLEKIGQSNIFSRITTLTGNEKENLVDQIVTAVMLLSKDQTGALISIEQSQSLDDYVATGTKLNSDVTAELLTSIFVTSTPLHDGAVIIQGDKIACASAYFPPTNADLPSRYGARHRAAIGFSEVTDAVTIVVSEETGAVSITEAGKIFSVNRDSLRQYLMRTIYGENTEVKQKRNTPDASNGILSKLKVKKQEEPVQFTLEKEPQTISQEKVHEQADAEARAASIKLPHKKKRPAASYPTQQKPIVPVSIKPAQSNTSHKPVEKMTPEQVQAAREASLNRLKAHKEEPIQKETPILNEEDKKFDTSKLDISQIVGFNDELDKQFKMVEKLDNTNSSTQERGDSNE